ELGEVDTGRAAQVAASTQREGAPRLRALPEPVNHPISVPPRPPRGRTPNVPHSAHGGCGILSGRLRAHSTIGVGSRACGSKRRGSVYEVAAELRSAGG